MYTKGHVPSKNERARPQDLLSEGMQTTAQGRQLTSETVGRKLDSMIRPFIMSLPASGWGIIFP